MAYEREPARSATQDVRTVRELFELREKGGLLGRINLRVFFFTHSKSRSLCVLGCIKKKGEGKTPNNIIVRMKNRKRIAEAALDKLGTVT